ncbi:MAG TPA: VanZ family protein [Armatimonadota bacterium]|nr:VanZ family protein [Armatimonadota bacterium]
MRSTSRWLPALGWMAVIFWLSSGVDVPGGIEVPDKAAHFAAYAVLGALLWWAAAPLGVGRAGALAMMVGAIYGAGDEFHQHFVPGRTPDPLDWMADVGGVVVAVAIAAAMMGARRARRT